MQDLNNQSLVSVVIATYNMAQYLGAAVDSILAQTWKKLEVIVVDDGSTDNTAEVMSAYQDDKRIKYIQNENQGQPKAKNCGIQNTAGDFIAFCDADDLWEPYKLEHQIPLFDNPNVGVVYSDISNIDEFNNRYEKPRQHVFHRGKITNNIIMYNFIPFGSSVFRRSCIEKNGIFDENFRMGIDWDLWLRYSVDWEFDYTDARTYIYRVWPGQMSKNYRGRYDHAFRILDKFAQEHGHKLPKKVLANARADNFIGKGNIIARREKKFFEPMGCILQGIATSPTYGTGWRSLAKLFLRRS